MKRCKKFILKGGAGFVTSLFCLCVVLPAAGSGDGGMNNAKESVGVIKRDPFWPVGYVPKEIVQAAKQKGTEEVAGGSWKEAMKRVSIDGISRSAGSEYYAIINGQVKSAGDTVSVRLGNSLYTWAVESIDAPGSVKLRRLKVR